MNPLVIGKCYDEYTYCREFSSLCADPTYGDIMAKHCTLTCKRCDDIEMEDEYEGDRTADVEMCAKSMNSCSLQMTALTSRLTAALI